MSRKHSFESNTFGGVKLEIDFVFEPEVEATFHDPGCAEEFYINSAIAEVNGKPFDFLNIESEELYESLRDEALESLSNYWEDESDYKGDYQYCAARDSRD